MSSADKRRTNRGSRWSAARIAVFSIILVLLAVGFLPSVSAGVRQAQQIRALEKQNSQTQEEIDQLEKRRKDFDDPEYVKKLAREKHLYAEDGETLYIVVDEDREDTAAGQSNKGQVDRPWYQELADYMSTVGMASEDQ